MSSILGTTHPLALDSNEGANLLDVLADVAVSRSAIAFRQRWDKRTGKLCVNQQEIGDHVKSYQWIKDNWPYKQRTGARLDWGTTGAHVKSYHWIQSHWPYDQRAGARLDWGTTGTHVATYKWIQTHWPYDKNTGKKLPWGTTGTHVKSYQWILDNSPYDKRTGKKLEWGTEGTHVATYKWIQTHWPFNKNTGEKLKWGVKGPDVITYRARLKLKSRLIYSRDIFDKKGELIHTKGSPIAPRTQVKKWGPGTQYKLGPERANPAKRKRVTTKSTPSTRPPKTARHRYQVLSQERNRLFTHGQTDTRRDVDETTSQHIRGTITV